MVKFFRLIVRPFPVALLFIICSFLASRHSTAQAVENVSATLKGEQIIIEYNLKDEVDEFTIKLFSSHDGFKSPVQLAAGDIGEHVKPGQKTITWEAKKELITFKGELTFEIRATPTPITLISPGTDYKVKRSKTLDVQWLGGKRNETITISLLKGNSVIQNIGTTENTKKYTWTIPKKIKTGVYQVRLNGATSSVTSEPFKIKSRINTLIKILPAAIIGVVILTTGGGSETSGSNDLPKPINPN
jgi:hypothetical protein